MTPTPTSLYVVIWRAPGHTNTGLRTFVNDDDKPLALPLDALTPFPAPGEIIDSAPALRDWLDSPPDPDPDSDSATRVVLASVVAEVLGWEPTP